MLLTASSGIRLITTGHLTGHHDQCHKYGDKADHSTNYKHKVGLLNIKTERVKVTVSGNKLANLPNKIYRKIKNKKKIKKIKVLSVIVNNLNILQKRLRV